MRLVLFIKDEPNLAKWPDVRLEHLTAHLNVSHICLGDNCIDDIQLDFHHFTPAHARQLIEMLTPIAAQEVPVEQPA